MSMLWVYIYIYIYYCYCIKRHRFYLCIHHCLVFFVCDRSTRLFTAGLHLAVHDSHSGDGRELVAVFTHKKCQHHRVRRGVEFTGSVRHFVQDGDRPAGHVALHTSVSK